MGLDFKMPTLVGKIICNPFAVCFHPKTLRQCIRIKICKLKYFKMGEFCLGKYYIVTACRIQLSKKRSHWKPQYAIFRRPAPVSVLSCTFLYFSEVTISLLDFSTFIYHFTIFFNKTSSEWPPESVIIGKDPREEEILSRCHLPTRSSIRVQA